MRIPGLELHATVDTLPWRPTTAPGVDWYLLASEERGDGAAAGATVLIRMAPGCGYPPHRHLDVEEVLILSGGYRDADGEHRAGSYLRYAPGSAHAPVALGDAQRPAGPENPACVLYASARGGIEVLTRGAPPAPPSPSPGESR